MRDERNEGRKFERVVLRELTRWESVEDVRLISGTWHAKAIDPCPTLSKRGERTKREEREERRTGREREDTAIQLSRATNWLSSIYQETLFAP
jgi:hypothetical protein